MRESEFYIGWQATAPEKIAHTIRAVVLVLLICIPLTAFILVLHQNTFRNARFEYGKNTTVTGILRTEPAPFLQVYRGTDMQGQRVHQNILLVAPGKHGIDEMLASREEMLGHSLQDMAVTLQGFLIYHDGKTLLEVESMQDIRSASMIQDTLIEAKPYGEGTLIGEITDPKCLFGVMKPGEGKPHRSCAARCIEGGIPPVLKTTRADGSLQFYLIGNADDAALKKQLLSCVGDQVAMCGQIEQLGDWMVFYQRPDQDLVLMAGGSPDPAMCGR